MREEKIHIEDFCPDHVPPGEQGTQQKFSVNFVQNCIKDVVTTKIAYKVKQTINFYLSELTNR